MKKLTLAVSLACLAPVAMSQQAYGQVIQASPFYENVVVGQSCQDLSKEVPRPRYEGGALIGAAVGGGTAYVLNASSHAIAVWAIVGGMVGDHIQNYDRPTEYVTVTRCAPVTEPRLAGTNFIVEFQGYRKAGFARSEIKVGQMIPVR